MPLIMAVALAACSVTGYEEEYKVSAPTITRITNDAPYPDEVRKFTKETYAEELKLDLKGVVAMFLRNNREYLTQLESLFVSKLNMELARHTYDPILNPISASISGSDSMNADPGASESLSTSISQRLPFGGSLSVNTSGSGSQATTGRSYTMTNSISFSLPLIRGAGALIALNNVIQSSRAYAYAQREFANFKETALINVVRNFYSLIRAKRQIENFRANHENAKKLLVRAQIEFDLGRRRKSEVFRSQVQVTTAETQLRNAEEDYKLQEDRFKIDLGLDSTTIISLEPVAFEFKELEINSDEYIEKALKQNRGWLNATDQFEDSKRTLYIAYNALFPDVSVTASASDTLTSKKPAKNFDETAESLSAGLSFSYELDRFPIRAQFHNQLLAFNRAKRGLELSRDQLIREARAKIIQTQRAAYNVRTNTRAVGEAENNLKLVTIEYEEGANNRSSLDVVTAQRELLDAQNNLESSVVEYRIILLELRQFIAELDVSQESWFE